MRYKKDPDRLYLFITISIFIHLFIFILFPYGNLSVLGNNDGTQEYDFMQMVEYKVKNSTADSQSTTQVKETSKNTKSRTDEEVVKKAEQVENKSNLKEKIESRAKEELDNVEKSNNEAESPNVTEKKKVNNKSNTEADVKTNKTNNKLNENTESEVNTDTKKIVENNNSSDNGDNILSSENSEVEIEVNESKKDNKNSSGQDRDSKTGENEKNGQDTEKISESENTKTVSSPPPPSSAGEMLLGHPKPAYPKDLYGEAPSGEVQIQVHVSSSGEIEALQIIKTSGFEQMDRIAKLTVEKGWEFKTYQKSYSMIIKVEFMLDEDGNDNVKVSQGNLVFK